MPPIQSTIQKETRSLIDSLTRRQKDLEEFQISRLRDCKGPLVIQQQYASELREDLESFARDLKQVELLAEDQDRPREKREVLQYAKAFSESLTRLKKEARIASLTSKRTIDSMTMSARKELLRSAVISEQKYDEKSGDAVMVAGNNVTEALRRTMTLMQAELERSVLSSQMLDQSSATLRATTTQHDTLSSLIDTSKHLITTLEKSDWLDRFLLLGGLCFFLLVVGFILKQRVFDKSVRIIFWWTRFLPNFSDDAALLKADAEAALTVAASAALTTTATLLSQPPTSTFIPEEPTSTLSQIASAMADVDNVIQTLLEDSTSIFSEQAPISSISQNSQHMEL